MPDNLFHTIHDHWIDAELPAGHLNRFQNKLQKMPGLPRHLWTVQRIAVAASVAAFLVLSITVLLNMQSFFARKAVLYGISSELYETELFLRNEIFRKIEILKSVDKLDKEILNDIREIDESFAEVCTELQVNPNDDRLTSAVIATYRIKIELLDEILERTRENKM